MAGYAAAVFTPTYVALYKVVERIFGPQLSVVNAARKAVAVICVGGPFVNSIMLAVSTHAERMWLGKPATREEADALVAQKLRHDVPRLLIASLGYWGPLTTLNFAFTPPQFRVVVVSVGSVLWNCYLSCVAHRHLG